MLNQSHGDHYWEPGAGRYRRSRQQIGASGADLKATAEALENQIRAWRFGQPSEIARAVVFMASVKSVFTVGSELGGLGL
jgi:NAD(P)-dependent dehydrogenase (short-subunit alcohol dehydrogenase family)